VRAGGDADYGAAAGVYSFFQVGGGVAYFGDVFRVGDAGVAHGFGDHVGVGASAGDFVAGYGRVDQVGILPAQSREHDVDDVSGKAGVERHLDAGGVQAAKRLGTEASVW